MNYLKVLTKGALFIAVAISLSSCLKNKGTEIVQPDVAFLSVYHASPGTLKTDFVLDGQLVTAGLEYKSNKGYYTLYTGSRAAAFYKENSYTDTIRTKKFTAEKDSIYSLFLIGPASNPETLLIRDHLTAPATGKANVRFVNLSPDAGSFTLKAIATSVDTTFFDGINYKTATNFSAVTPRTYKLELHKGGTKVTDLADVAIGSGKNYTIWATGLDGDPNNELKPVIKVTENK
ncbi:DUF4397 domain-containing protein [Pseudopedobacter sp.]|uniref:DUF4397 domain-containing protein n=1 Tax=Pseudopedobacter sp. TaxID=1936787 RepID=UPI00334296BF